MIGTTAITRLDVERARAAQVPAPSRAQAERLLIEAAVVSATERDSVPDKLDVAVALDDYKQFLRTFEFDHPGTRGEWLPQAHDEIAARAARLGVTKGPCSYQP